MASNSVIFKVFLRSDGSPEARKFIIDDASVITSYIFIRGKLVTIFPKLNHATFKITWKDTEGDEIIIDSDEDLIMAFMEMSGPIKTLYVTVSPSQPSTQYASCNVYCDACNKPITGYRYKCLQCVDFDLCIDCEHAGHHTEHYMLRSSDGELPFGPTCRGIANTINKTMRKAQAMAYKEACRSAKASRKFDKKFDHHNKHEKGYRYDSRAGPSGCPMNAPIFDFVNAAAQAAYAGFTPQAPPENRDAQKEQPQQEQQSQQSHSAQPPPNFVEMMIKALNNIFPQQKSSADVENPTKTPTTTPANEQSQPTTPASAEHTPTPMEEDCEHVRAAGRSPSWTILDNDISIQNHSQETAPSPSAPPLDPKILEGLKQLRDMGFGDYPNLVGLLKRYEGNVGNVIRHMFDNI